MRLRWAVVVAPLCWAFWRFAARGFFCRFAALRDGLRHKEGISHALYGTAEAVP
jgi:hypothetical protein